MSSLMRQGVSVPLPGFSGLRRLKEFQAAVKVVCFSPVAGIQWVETCYASTAQRIKRCFSPVAGIQWVETVSFTSL